MESIPAPDLGDGILDQLPLSKARGAGGIKQNWLSKSDLLVQKRRL
jgi:hypothetical protein